MADKIEEVKTAEVENTDVNEQSIPGEQDITNTEVTEPTNIQPEIQTAEAVKTPTEESQITGIPEEKVETKVEEVVKDEIKPTETKLEETTEVFGPDLQETETFVRQLNELSENRNLQDVFSDRDRFNQFFNFDNLTDQQKNIANAFYQSRNVRDADSIFDELMLGNQIFNKDTRNSEEFKLAQDRLSRVRRFNNLTSEDLLNNVNAGVVTDKDIKDMQRTPEGQALVREMQQLDNTISKAKANIDAKRSGLKMIDAVKKGDTTILEKEEEPSYVDTLNNEMQDKFIEITKSNKIDIDLLDAYNKAYDTNEIQESTSNVTDLETEIRTIDDDIKNLEDDVRAGFAKGTPQAVIASRVARATKDLLRKRDTLNIKYQDAKSRLSSLKEEALNKYNIQVQQYNIDKANRTEAINEFNTLYGLYKDNRNWEWQKGAEDRAWDQALRLKDLERGNIDSADPASRKQAIVSSVDRILTEFAGIPIQRSRQQIISDIQNLVDKGVDLGTALTMNLRQPIMSKPEYEDWKTKKLGGGLSNKYDIKQLGEYEDDNGNTHKKYGVFENGKLKSTYGGIPTTIGTGQTILNESPIETDIKNVYGTNIKLAPTVANKLQSVMDLLKENGVNLEIGDSFRSFETQQRAYEKDQALPPNKRKGVAPPDTSFHVLGQAFDIAQTDENKKNIGLIKKAFEEQGIMQHPGEWWHFSYGEFNEQPNKSGESYGYNKEEIPLYDRYLNKGVLPSGLTPAKERKFITNAEQYKTDTGFISKDDKEKAYKYNKDFESSSLYKEFIAVQDKKDTVVSLVDNFDGGPSDVALVFEFMKALDPTSVVRETEFDAAATSGNLFDGWAARFNGYFKEGGQKIPEDVRKEFKKIVEDKYKIKKQQFSKNFDETKRLIELTSDVSDGSIFMKNILADEPVPETVEGAYLDYLKGLVNKVTSSFDNNKTGLSDYVTNSLNNN